MAVETELTSIDVEDLLQKIRDRHLSETILGGIISPVQFYPRHFASGIPARENFSEGAYLRLNPDAALAVERGEFRSGYDHWLECGRAEGRAFESADLSSETGDAGGTSLGWESKERDTISAERLSNTLSSFVSRLTRLDSAAGAQIAAIGEPPPSPATLRGWVGRAVIVAMRRMLWWYTQSLREFGSMTDHRLREQTDAIETLRVAQKQSRKELSESAAVVRDLRQKLKDLESSGTALAAGLAGEVSARKTLAASLDQTLQTCGRIQYQCESAEKTREDLLRKIESSSAALTSGLAAEMHAREALAEHFEFTWNTAEKIREELLRKIESSSAALTSGLAAEMHAREALAALLDNIREQHVQADLHYGTVRRHLEQMRAELTHHSGRVGRLLRNSRPQDLENPGSGDGVDNADSSYTDALYVEFEETFRGSRVEVKQRHRVYLPHLVAANAGAPVRPVVDLGCGRGEWLELLREEGFSATGVDRNQSMIEACREIGLDVSAGEALEHMKMLPDASVGAVTAFHMVEHLPFELIPALLDQAMRILAPGGLLIFETPNPGNLIVGANTFYLDPTHRRPLPSAMLRFFVEARGFVNSRVLLLHPFPVPFAPGGDSVSQGLNDLLSGPRDYAIIAERP